jgi:hypothetical protein
MTKLSDMGKFPWVVHLGASLNIIFTIWLTRTTFLYSHGDLLYLPVFASFMIAVNILPVIILRLLDTNTRPYPDITRMDFFRDQHRFSSWVYAIASANMFFWITISWCVFSINTELLVALQIFSFILTYVPLWRNCIKVLAKR